MSGKNPNLTVVTAADSGATKPPHPSGREGLALWHRFLAKFRISDPDDLELLLLACEPQLGAAVRRHHQQRGPGRPGHGGVGWTP
jgi:hypothetical protein